MEWLSVYLFFEGDLYGEAGDRVAREIVRPLVEAHGDEVDRWFFIRYSEEGPHLRLRFRAPPESLAARLWPRIEEKVASTTLVHRAARVAYEPEVKRYGGPRGVALAEDLFQSSSQTALALLAKIEPGDRPSRLGKGLLAMLVLLYLYLEERSPAAELARRYGTSYLRMWAGNPDRQRHWLREFQEGFDRQADHLVDYVELAWQALATGQELTAELDAYRRDMEEMARRLRGLFDQGQLEVDGATATPWDRCMRAIVPSYIHMMSNRLGITIQEESYLSVLISETLAGSRNGGGAP